MDFYAIRKQGFVMKIFLDNTLIRKIIAGGAESFSEMFHTVDFLKDPQESHVIFGWPSLLEWLDLESLFEVFPKFDPQNPLFALVMSTLIERPEKEFLILLYDQIFVECLTQVKALPPIDAAFLLHQIQEKRKCLNPSIEKIFSLSLDRYEKLLKENPSYFMHDLILYLAWDHVCINLAMLFEYPVPHLNIQKHLATFKECLEESFQHITAHGRTAPSFFRMIETLYAYQMREENFETHTESDWLILCQGSKALKSREKLSDAFYIDAAIINEQQLQQSSKEVLKVLTLDSFEKVQACLSLTNYMITKLKLEAPGWHYTLSPVEIVCLQKDNTKE